MVGTTNEKIAAVSRGIEDLRNDVGILIGWAAADAEASIENNAAEQACDDRVRESRLRAAQRHLERARQLVESAYKD